MGHAVDPSDITHGLRGAWDGMARCSVCGGSDSPAPDEGWCPLTGSLLCDSCCRALLFGEAQRMLEMIEASEPLDEPTEAARTCANCPRIMAVIEDELTETHEPEALH
jgi:hypothetical protein